MDPAARIVHLFGFSLLFTISTAMADEVMDLTVSPARPPALEIPSEWRETLLPSPATSIAAFVRYENLPGPSNVTEGLSEPDMWISSTLPSPDFSPLSLPQFPLPPLAIASNLSWALLF